MDQSFDRWDLGIGLLLIIGGAAILAWTLPDYGLTWDEAIYLDLTLAYVDYFDSLGPENPFSWSDLPKVFPTIQYLSRLSAMACRIFSSSVLFPVR